MSEPVEEFLGWLEREERELGFTTVEEGLEDLELAQAMLYGEVGYDINERQFARLKEAQYLRYEELPSIGVAFRPIEQPYGWVESYYDVISGQFVAKADVYSLLATIR